MSTVLAAQPLEALLATPSQFYVFIASLFTCPQWHQVLKRARGYAFRSGLRQHRV